MRVLHLNTFDQRGGAARTAWRLIQGLRSLGVDAPLHVGTKEGGDPDTHGPATAIGKALTLLRYNIEPLRMRRYPERPGDIFLNWLPERMLGRIRAFAPDIVHLHWVLAGLLRIETIGRIGRPIVWTMHDMWPIAGGCAYGAGCTRYEAQCGACPILGSSDPGDFSHRVWQRKQAAWKRADITLVTYGSWLVEAAKKSSLFRDRRVEMIMAGVDLGRYKPTPAQAAREILGLPQDRKLVLFGALSVREPNKGIDLLQQAVQRLADQGWRERLDVVIFGADRVPEGMDLPVRAHCLGRLHDDWTLALAYSAADAFVAPSRQDVGPQTVTESMACGTPVVGFRVGGLPDRIDHLENGFMASPFDTAELAHGIAWILEDKDRRGKLGRACRDKAERLFGMAAQACAYSK